MKTFAILMIAAAVFSCGGELSKEQKDRIRQSMEDGQIRRVSPGDLTEAGYVLGRTITGKFSDDQYLSDPSKVYDVSRTYGVTIFSLKEGVRAPDAALRILEAYQGAPDAGDLQENVQKIGKDTLLYTMPVRFDRPDGSRVFSHAIAVLMPVRIVVKTIE
ncbi:MAG: hypothetical protein ACKORJ_10740 [Bacteroidota bacterium]